MIIHCSTALLDSYNSHTEIENRKIIQFPIRGLATYKSVAYKEIVNRSDEKMIRTSDTAFPLTSAIPKINTVL